jgi:hypothetical protein
VWGADDQLGTLNNITPDTSARAARLVEHGVRVNLDLPIHLPFGALPQTHPRRKAPTQTLFKGAFAGLMHRDDKIDDLFLQGSSQWDGLSHIGDPELGFYNGVKDEEVTQREGTRNGIEHLAEFGIFTRGVLADVLAYFNAMGRRWNVMGSDKVTVEELAACLEWQKAKLSPGDVLLVRMGWVGEFLTADPERKQAMWHNDWSGLVGDETMWQFLWDNRVSALASDTVPVEVFPVERAQVTLHWAIPRLGLTLGELFALDELPSRCRQFGRHDFLFVSKPLNLRGGVGSPPNAMAVF